MAHDDFLKTFDLNALVAAASAAAAAESSDASSPGLGAIGSERGSKSSGTRTPEEATPVHRARTPDYDAPTTRPASSSTGAMPVECNPWDEVASVQTDSVKTPPLKPAQAISAVSQQELVDPNANIYIAWLPRSFQEDDLARLVSPFGRVASMHLVTSASRTYAFVLYETIAEAQVAVEALNTMRFNGRRLQARFSSAHDGTRLSTRTAPTTNVAAPTALPFSTRAPPQPRAARGAPARSQKPHVQSCAAVTQQARGHASPMVLVLDPSTGTFQLVSLASVLSATGSVAPYVSSLTQPMAAPPVYAAAFQSAVPAYDAAFGFARR
jgi:hypothetical protein